MGSIPVGGATDKAKRVSALGFFVLPQQKHGIVQNIVVQLVDNWLIKCYNKSESLVKTHNIGCPFGKIKIQFTKWRGKNEDSVYRRDT